MATVAATLIECGWINVDGWESGFIYPKKRVRKVTAEILQSTREVERLCKANEAEILNIDADTSSDGQQSKFITLYRLPT